MPKRLTLASVALVLLPGMALAQTATSVQSVKEAYGARMSANGQTAAELAERRVNRRLDTRVNSRLDLRIQRYRIQSDDPADAYRAASTAKR